MATETILSEDEQAAMYHKTGFEIGAEIATKWEATIDNPAIAPAALLGAIESLVVALLGLVGSEATRAFLNRLADDIHRASTEDEKPE
jgi:hypothetical protein